ncbi:thiamine pyrophosphate-binding protein [Bosea thiooxidans]|uniref:Acetolactate synthase-1/2/3 large subunit n=1 Tax=Bosea thiooxidans TaxID=53254 RepID=A0A0Q3I0S2_9HYPH|nr:thiamine pyrophosphate-binding protein [Bosea thiooxidans]KQK28575.1 thiamine pyrophosphate-binding protein [Bosea thiooxidans]SKC13913.1 acetolactate synthase-1/2/3 large subunit [Bosea thiooxidans]
MGQQEGRTGAQILVDCLRLQAVDRVFCVPGESYISVLDALHDVRDEIDLVVCRQEGGAANMAEAHGKLTGRPGICFVTRGPGATNASIGVHTAFQDSTPMILFIGQVGRDFSDREGFQEVDFRAMFAPLAKWAAQIEDASRIPEYLHRAFQTAMAGRPGPVVLALPEDMLAEVVEADLDLGRRAEAVASAARPDQIEQVMSLLAKARKPMVIAGGGGWTEQAGRDLVSFASRNQLPVAVSLRCQDYLPNREPCFVGHFGIGAEPSLARRLAEADLLLVLGPRLGEMTTAGYTLLVPPRPRGKVLVHAHSDANELGRVYQADLPIHAAAGSVAAALAACEPTPEPAWAAWTAACRADYEASLAPSPQPGAVNLGEVVEQLRAALPDETIMCSGAGNYTGWLHRHWPFNSYRTQLAPTSGAMGYGVPAAIAAKLTCPEREVVSVAGDGCFMMNGQELATAVQYGLKILFIVVNNGMYGTIRMHQERHYPTRVSGTALVNPDFVTLARAYGLHAERVEQTADFEAALERARKAAGSALIELVTDPEALSVRSTLSKLRSASLERLAPVA